MRTPIYVKADKFVKKCVELYKVLCVLQEQSKGIVNGNYMDSYIRTYAFKFHSSMNAYHLDVSTSIYREIVKFGSKSRVMARHGYEMSFYDKSETEFSTVNNSEENEFQLSLLHDEHTLYLEYCKEKFKEQLPEINELFLGTTDIRRITPAIKAAKELIRGDIDESK